MERATSDLYSARAGVGGGGILSLYRVTDYNGSVYLLFTWVSPNNFSDITSKEAIAASFHILSNSLCTIVPLPFDTVQS
jgi:hypothetical protein